MQLSVVPLKEPLDSRRPSPFLHKYGPWALVTGASDGIGRELAIELAARGLNLVLVARRKPLLEQLSQELKCRHSIEVMVLDLDLASEGALQELISQTQNLDIGLVIPSAGFGTSGPFIDSDLQTQLQMLDVNCRAVLALCHHFGNRFKARNSGGLVLMSSLLAFQGTPGSAHYAATKAYIQNLAEGLRWELKPYGVEVLASAPGPAHSGFADRANLKMGKALPASIVAKGTLAALGRVGTVRPGFLSQFLELGLKMLPRTGRVLMMRKVMGGMTKHQSTTGAREKVESL